MTKYPQAGEYIWEKIGMRISEYSHHEEGPEIERHYISIFGMQLPSPQDPYFRDYLKGFIQRRIGLRKKVGSRKSSEEKESTFMLLTKEHMNPVDYWYYNNPELKAFMDTYWSENKRIIKDEQLLKDATYLYEGCKAVYDKLLSLSLIAAYKLLFSNE